MGISIWQLLIVLVIVMLLFGTKKLSSIGRDIGGAVKGFRSEMGKEEASTQVSAELENKEGRVIEGEVAPSEQKDKV